MQQIDPMKREGATAVLVDFCHAKSRFQDKKYFGHFLWKIYDYVAKNPVSLYFGQNSEMQNYQDCTDPTVHIQQRKISQSYYLTKLKYTPTGKE